MSFGARSFRLLPLLVIAACTARDETRPDSTAAAPPANAPPAWLQPIFRELDTLLTDAHRDTLRLLTLDSAFAYRVRRLGPIVESRKAEWVRTPAGDTIIARGEKSDQGTVMVALDLYQQHLRGERLDVDAAVRRYSLDYAWEWGRKVTFDSTLLERDIDGSGRPDRIALERRTGDTPREQGGITEIRVSVFLDGSTTPAWSTHWLDDMEAGIRGVQPLGGGLLQVDLTVEETEETILVHSRDGAARMAFRHEIEGGDGGIRVATSGGRVIVTASKGAEVEGKRVVPTESCGANAWPALTVAYDDSTRRFSPVGSTCLARPE
ncbi:MAG TPA: hypothetical protein VFO66_03895 [Gemmatimonadaceae bacterium]|nr:hypothetical protein [Gemmatimonadaceae bacterium]